MLTESEKRTGKGVRKWGLSVAIIVAISVMAAGVFFHVGADTSNADDVPVPTMVFDSETGALTITGAGEITQANVNATIGGGKLKTVWIGNEVTSVGDSAFAWNSDLTSVEFEGECLASIGAQAFIMCENLSTVTFADNPSIGNKAFIHCNKLTSITIPATVKSIGDSSFSDTAITTVTVSSAVTSLGKFTFSDCQNLVTAELNCQASAIGVGIFKGCHSLTDLTLPAMEDIPRNMFEDCYKYKASLPENVKTIGDYAYSGCNIESVEFPSTLVSIGKFSFSNCNKLKSVSFAECGSAEIGRGAFSSCPILKNVILPDSIPLIGDSLFKDCITLADVSIPSTVRTIDSDAFNGCSSLKVIILPDELQAIGASAFYRCSSIESIILPSSVISLGVAAFKECESLATIEIPSTLQTIGNMVFERCTSLKSFVAGEGLNKLGESAFIYCSGLKTVDLSASSSLESIPMRCFAHCESLESVLLSESGLLDICDGAFFEAKAIESFDIPASVKTIGKVSGWNMPVGTFCACISLNTITGGEGLVSIEDRTFLKCISLPSFSGLNLNEDYFTIKDNVIYSKFGDDLRMIQLACAAKGDFVIPDNVTAFSKYAMSYSSVKSIVFGGGTSTLKTSVGENVNLTSVTIPEGVTSIDCEGLWDIEGMFSGCKSLVSVSLPSTLEMIGGGTFKGCTSLESIALPKNMTTLGGVGGAGAFENCTSLKEVTVLGSIKEQDTDIVLPMGITVLGYNTFYGCSSVENVFLNVELIREGNFSKCDSLKSVKFGIYTESITDSFNHCKSLSSVTLDGIDLNVERSFKNCDGLKTVHLGDGVKSIEGSFIDCKNMESITVSYYNSNLATFKGVIYSADYSRVILIPSYVVDLELPDSVKNMPRLDTCRDTLKSIIVGNGINDILFNIQGCKYLESLTLGTGISQIYMNALRGCDSLVNVYVKSDKMIVGDGLIYNHDCSEIYAPIPAAKSVVIRDSISSIPGGLFMEEWKNLESITFGTGITAEIFETTAGKYGGCPSLIEFKFNTSGIVFTDGLVLSADGERLIMCVPGIEEVRISDTVKVIGSSAFANCNKPIDLSLPSGVETILEGGISWSGIRSISIPSSVKTIEDGSICGCTALESIIVSPDNSFYAVKDGVLYSKADFRSIAVCGAFSTVTIPDEVKIIGAKSVSCRNILTVILGPNVMEIEEQAFFQSSVADLFVTGDTMPVCLYDVGVYNLRVHSNIEGGVFDGYHYGFTYDNLPQTKITVISIGDGHNFERPISTVIPNGGNISFIIMVSEDYEVTVESSAGTVNQNLFFPRLNVFISDIGEDATITIKSVRIMVEAEGVTLDVHEVTTGSNAPYILNATFVPENTTEIAVWSSSDTSIATVDAGVVTPLSNGSVTITITLGDFSDSCTITFISSISTSDVENNEVVMAIAEGNDNEVLFSSDVVDRIREYSASIKSATIGNGVWTINVPASDFEVLMGSGKDVIASVTSVGANELPENIQAVANGRTVFSIDVIHNGEHVPMVFGTSVTVTVLYDLPAGLSANNLRVVCLDGGTDGEKYDATYSDGHLTFSVPHFSYWAVEYEDSQGNVQSNGLMSIVFVTICISALTAACMIKYRPKI